MPEQTAPMALTRASRPSTWLAGCGPGRFSQDGEDRAIAALLDLLPNRTGWCVEFGAGDGIHLSNSRDLIISRGYQAVLDRSRSGALRSAAVGL